MSAITSWSLRPERPIPDWTPSRTTYENAETLAKAEGLIPRTVAFNGFVEEAMKGGRIW